MPSQVGAWNSTMVVSASARRADRISFCQKGRRVPS
jgi:hypothetical protein